MRGRINRPDNKVTRLANFAQRTKARLQALTRVQVEAVITTSSERMSQQRQALPKVWSQNTGAQWYNCDERSCVGQLLNVTC